MAKKIILKDDDLDKVSGGQEIGVHEFEYGDFHCQNCYYVMGTIAEVNEGDVCPQCGHVQTFKTSIMADQEATGSSVKFF
jgi:rRNA maturation endonuclease Nob1